MMAVHLRLRTDRNVSINCLTTFVKAIQLESKANPNQLNGRSVKDRVVCSFIYITCTSCRY